MPLILQLLGLACFVSFFLRERMRPDSMNWAEGVFAVFALLTVVKSMEWEPTWTEQTVLLICLIFFCEVLLVKAWLAQNRAAVKFCRPREPERPGPI